MSLVVDFDGTITEVDLLGQIARRFGDPEVFEELEQGLRSGALTLREAITRELAPVTAPVEEVVGWVLERARVRPGLHELVELAHDRGWDFLVLSSNVAELIEPVLAREGVDVELVANRVEASPSGWRVIWRDETVCPACGEACKRSGLPDRGEVVYVGDGLSDRCAALAADRVFARRRLGRYLSERGVPYEPFDDFFDVAGALTP